MVDDDIREAMGIKMAPQFSRLHLRLQVGRQTEIDARNGVMSRLGRKHGIPTPMNDFAFAVISAAEQP